MSDIGEMRRAFDLQLARRLADDCLDAANAVAAENQGMSFDVKGAGDRGSHLIARVDVFPSKDGSKFIQTCEIESGTPRLEIEQRIRDSLFSVRMNQSVVEHRPAEKGGAS